MAELTGADAVKQYILLANKCCVEVYRQNDSAQAQPIFEWQASNSRDAADKFMEWARIATPGNMSIYQIIVSPGMDKNAPDLKKEAINKRHASMTATFTLNEQPTGIGMPTRDKEGNVIYYMPQQQAPAPINGAPAIDMTNFVAKAEMQAAILHAVENAQLNERLRQLEAENLELYSIVREYEGDDDEEDEEEDMSGIAGVMKVWTPDKVNELVGTLKNGVIEIMGAKPDNPGKLNQVAGPQSGTQTADVAVPANGVAGKLPPHCVPKSDAEKKLVEEDQNIKLNDALVRLAAKDMHIGDDLQIIAMIAEKKPNRFNTLILSLREE